LEQLLDKEFYECLKLNKDFEICLKINELIQEQYGCTVEMCFVQDLSLVNVPSEGGFV